MLEVNKVLWTTVTSSNSVIILPLESHFDLEQKQTMAPKTRTQTNKQRQKKCKHMSAKLLIWSSCAMRLLCIFFLGCLLLILSVRYELVCRSLFFFFWCAFIQNFIDSLCRQSVDIGYYYYFGFVLYMACCELISIGYFFVCLSRISF